MNKMLERTQHINFTDSEKIIKMQAGLAAANELIKLYPIVVQQIHERDKKNT